MKKFFIYIFLILLILLILSSCIKIEPDFLLTLSNPDNSSIEMIGESYKIIDVIITPINGFSGNVEFSLIDDYFSLDGATNLTVNVSSEKKVSLRIRKADQAPVGNYNLKIKASSGTISKYINLNVNVKNEINYVVGSFSVSFDENDIKDLINTGIEQGDYYTLNVTVSPENAFAGNVNFELELSDGTPAPTGITILPNKVNIPNEETVSFKMIISVDTSVATGTYNLRLVAYDDTKAITKYIYFTFEVKKLNSNADFIIELDDSKKYYEIPTGGSIDMFIKIKPINDFSGDIKFNIYKYDDSTLSPDFSISPNVISINTTDPTNPIMFTITNLTSILGNYVVKIVATSGNTIREIFINLKVVPPTFTVETTTSELFVKQGDSGSLNVTVTPKNGFSGRVNFELESYDGTNTPSGITSFPNYIEIPDETTVKFNMIVTVDTSVATGTCYLRILAYDIDYTIFNYVYFTLKVTE